MKLHTITLQLCVVGSDAEYHKDVAQAKADKITLEKQAENEWNEKFPLGPCKVLSIESKDI